MIGVLYGALFIQMGGCTKFQHGISEIVLHLTPLTLCHKLNWFWHDFHLF